MNNHHYESMSLIYPDWIWFLFAFIILAYLLVHAMSNFVDNNKTMSDLPKDLKTNLRWLFNA